MMVVGQHPNLQSGSLTISLTRNEDKDQEEGEDKTYKGWSIHDVTLHPTDVWGT